MLIEARPMSVAVERRAARRVPTRALVSLQNGDGVRWAHALDISESGMFLRTFHPLSLGAVLKVTIDLDGGESIRASISPVRQDTSRDGYGVKFVQVDEAGAQAIRRFVSRSRF